MRSNRVIAKELVSNPKYKYLNMSLLKLKTLGKDGIINLTKENGYYYVLVSEVEDYIKRKNDIKDNYISFREFTIQAQNASTGTNLQPYKDALQKHANHLFIGIKTFNKKEYIQKKSIEMYANEYIHRLQAMEKLNISLYDYELLIKKHNIKEFKITTKNLFLSISEYTKLKCLISQTNISSSKLEWIKGTEIIKNPQYSHVAKKVETLISIADRGHFTYFKDINNTCFIERESFEDYSRLVSTLKQDYYCLLEIAKLFKITNLNTLTSKKKFTQKLLDFCISHNINYKILEIPIAKETTFIDKTKIDSFLKNHIARKELVKNYNITFFKLDYWIKEYCIKQIRFNYTSTYYSKLDIELVLSKLPHHLINTEANDEVDISANYYTLIQVKDILNIHNSMFQFMKTEEKLANIPHKGTSLYLKEDVDKLKQNQEEAKNKYYPPKYVMDKTNTEYARLPFTRFTATVLIKAALNVKEHVSWVYLKSEVDPYLEEKEKNKRINQLIIDDPGEMFLKQLEIHKITFYANSSFTKKQWIDHCINKLQLSAAHNQTIQNEITKLVKCTKHLINFIQDKELYLKQSSEINLGFFNHKTPITHQYILYGFLKRFYAELKTNLLPTFNIGLISNPYRNKKKQSHTKSIYSYDQYKDLFSYANNISLHKKKAIKDAVKKIDYVINKKSKKGATQHYASSWLYVLIHLNNAWRHVDICNLPSIDLKEIYITSLEDLINKDLTFDIAQKVINQVILSDLTVSKTQVTNYFFCSDELTISLATALVICQLILEGCYKLENQLIDFGNKKNIFSEGSHKAFFKAFKDKKFIFENRKMNRTLLTYMHVLLVQKGHGGAALEISQRFRAHKDFDTTNIYIQIPESELNHLTKQLFQRKHFGYIPHLFAEILLGEAQNREQRTKEIIMLNNKMGNIYNIEASSGFINQVLSNKKSVTNMIMAMGQEQVLDYLFKLNANLLPSKEVNLQCLVAETGCINPSISCRTCVYAIPNFYAISAIVESITCTLVNFKNKFENSKYEVEKIRLANLLFIEMDMLYEACKSFGKENVLQFFKGKKDGYFDLLSLLDDVDTEKDIVEFLTYQPKEMK